MAKWRKDVDEPIKGTCAHCKEMFYPEYEIFCKSCGRIANDSGLEPEPVDESILYDDDDDQF